MTVAARRAPPAADVQPGVSSLTTRAGRIGLATVAVPISLFVGALVVRLVSIAQLPFPLTEGSAYYTEVARNLVAGRGLVIDAIWSYATPPLILPRPAFELWQPMASLLAAAPMAVFGQAFGAAQLAAALLGSLLAPLTWLVAHDTAVRLGLPVGRARAVALGSGLIAVVFGPFLLAAAVPDSSLPYTVLAVTACLAMPAAIDGDRRAWLAIGALLGLAYLTRLEAVYVGLALVLMAVAVRMSWRRIATMTAVIGAVGGLVAIPWWLRNLLTFGSPLPGQLSDNLFLTRNEQIFGYLERPTLDGFLAQGPVTMAANIAAAAWHNLFNVLVIPGAPIVITGLLVLGLFIWRRRSSPAPTGSGILSAVLLAGALTFLFTTVLFPVATLWGTFEHAAGPLLVGLIVAAVVGGDALVAWIGERRSWQRNNTWIAPFALLVMVIPLAALQIGLAARHTHDTQQLFSDLSGSLPAALEAAGVEPSTPVISDRPIWLSEALGRPALALPDEPVPNVARLAAEFGARALVVVSERGRYPGALTAETGNPCFVSLANAGLPAGVVAFLIEPGCMP